MISTDNASVVINSEYFVQRVMVLDEMTSTRIITRIVTLCSRFSIWWANYSAQHACECVYMYGKWFWWISMQWVCWSLFTITRQQLLLTLASFRRCSRAKKRNLISAPITIMIRISKTAQTMPILVPAAITEIVMFYFGKSLKERWSSLV